jgi:hypothetical protein
MMVVVIDSATMMMEAVVIMMVLNAMIKTHPLDILRVVMTWMTVVAVIPVLEVAKWG